MAKQNQMLPIRIKICQEIALIANNSQKKTTLTQMKLLF